MRTFEIDTDPKLFFAFELFAEFAMAIDGLAGAEVLDLEELRVHSRGQQRLKSRSSVCQHSFLLTPTGLSVVLQVLPKGSGERYFRERIAANTSSQTPAEWR